MLLEEEEGVELPVRTIHRILERRGLLSDAVHGPAPQRFERAAPNELWQCRPLSILDEHSRCAVGLYALSALPTEQAYPCIVETWQRYGVPEAMLMDRGIWKDA